MAYQITFEQLEALAGCISEMDGKTLPCNNRKNAAIAHGVIEQVLGADVTKIYAPDDLKEPA